MASLILPALGTFGPSILSALGLFGQDPRQKLRGQISQLTSPQNQGRMTDQFFQQAMASPAFQQALRSIATGANVSSNRLSQSLGARGIGTSGTAAVLSSLTPSLVGSQRAQLNTSAFQGAQRQAQNAIQQQIQALLGTQGPSQTAQLGAVGFQSFLPFLMAALRGGGGGGGGGGGFPGANAFGAAPMLGGGFRL